LNVALAFNVKPESETFDEELSPSRTLTSTQTKKEADTFAEWDTWETINAFKSAIQIVKEVPLIPAHEKALETFTIFF
jgi:hypothetical protein